jgi:choline dehydrogenase-like flavoprotein
MDHVFLLDNAGWKHAREERPYDLVIVGTGFCGLAVAERALARDPHCRILMIERGTFFLPEHFQNLPLPFVNTLGGMSETFPWTLTRATSSGELGTIRWQHGMVPFFGGRSTLWSAWCPRPTVDEMTGWPQSTIDAAAARFQDAEELLHVQKANEIDAGRSEESLRVVASTRPVYGELQQCMDTLLQGAPDLVPSIYRTEPAPLASAASSVDGIDFEKYATPAELLKLVLRQRALAEKGEGSTLDIATEVIVERVVQQDGVATALDTSRGVLPLGDANLVLAMGALPPTTLVRNAFPDARSPGERFSAHFITSVVARVPAKDLDPDGTFGDLELAACYIAGKGKDYSQQFHVQLSVLHDADPAANAGTALRYMPDVVATASMAQLESSEGYVVFVCAVLGELDYDNGDTWFRGNAADSDPTTNSLLQVSENDSDRQTWDVMDAATFDVIEKVLSPKGARAVEYWHGAPEEGSWQRERPEVDARRVDALVHESSTMHIGEGDDAPVDLDYRVRGTSNVYMTGGALWPQGGSWNPTMTMVALSMDLADRLVPERGGR